MRPNRTAPATRGTPTSAVRAALSSGGLRTTVFVGAVLGALLLVLAETATLFDVRVAGRRLPIETVTTGSHDSYALIPVAALAIMLALAALRDGSRSAIVAIGVLGVVALLIALFGDLPDAHGNGLVGGATRDYVQARADPGTGLYLETLGAVVLIATAGLGVLMVAPPGLSRSPGSLPSSE